MNKILLMERETVIGFFGFALIIGGDKSLEMLNY